MKNLFSKEFCVELDGTKLYFRKPSKKELLDSDSRVGSWEQVFSSLVRVEGDVTIEEVASIDLPADAAIAIVRAYNKQISEWLGIKGSEEKNVSEPI